LDDDEEEGGTSSVARRKLWKGAEKTAATSLASRRGIRDSSTVGVGEAGAAVVVVVAVAAEEEEFEVLGPGLVMGVSPVWRRATQGRTTSSVRARFMGR